MEGSVRVSGRVLYGTVHEALKVAGFEYEMTDPKALLVWWDSVKDTDYFSSLSPFQIVNRIPAINNICRKAPFVRLIQRVQGFFPSLYSFLPQSYVLPQQSHDFMKAVSRHDRKHIVKPDNGSLGAGIKILEPGDFYTPTSTLAIAQEYVESCLVDSTKFDCRIYALIASVSPLRVFVYRGGVARFCSQDSSEHSVYSQLTNTAVNRNNPDADISRITRMVTDVFRTLKSRGVDTKKLWQKIDSAIVLTIIAAYGYISGAEAKQCPPSTYPRCFQILGFDVLIDENYNPVVMEVNYRPSLEADTEAERRMKVEMLSSAMRIVAPLECVQRAINGTTETFRTPAEWKAFLNRDVPLVKEIHEKLAEASESKAFVRVFPGAHPDYDKWLTVLEKVKTMPTDYERQSRLPVSINGPSVHNTTLSVRVVVPDVVKRMEEERKEQRPSKASNKSPAVLRSVNPNTQKLCLCKPNIKKPVVQKRLLKRIS